MINLNERCEKQSIRTLVYNMNFENPDADAFKYISMVVAFSSADSVVPLGRLGGRGGGHHAFSEDLLFLKLLLCFHVSEPKTIHLLRPLSFDF